MNGKIIDINQYRIKKMKKNKSTINNLEEEERKKTLNLFIKVLETMEKESSFKM
ncbi:hypothetical protein [Alkaliphilus peptidifermentans]|uniref:Uncharacterized protein n=1 Tax=Alkaliphilus peptidifermentans DSM 18978 TaxID=1120976 RepID=A0A1G5L7R8_9FIRM|nr:hypothetical protein [Alkaliphilus peptidifermentans]SCZ08320.1 hypothetical protein SAMN03080606_04107 [Alkaliphilus peptidifermentans DSM 18978]